MNGVVGVAGTSSLFFFFSSVFFSFNGGQSKEQS